MSEKEAGMFNKNLFAILTGLMFVCLLLNACNFQNATLQSTLQAQQAEIDRMKTQSAADQGVSDLPGAAQERGYSLFPTPTTLAVQLSTPTTEASDSSNLSGLAVPTTTDTLIPDPPTHTPTLTPTLTETTVPPSATLELTPTATSTVANTSGWNPPGQDKNEDKFPIDNKSAEYFKVTFICIGGPCMQYTLNRYNFSIPPKTRQIVYLYQGRYRITYTHCGKTETFDHQINATWWWLINACK
jgi:hypothetical protein